MEEGFRFRSVTYRPYPNSSQEAALKRSLDLCHELYNRLLGWSLDHYRTTGEKLPRFDLNRVMTRISASEPGMRSDVYSTCRQNVTGRVHRALAGCRPGRTGVLIHVPRFKSSNRYHSFCYESPNGFGFKGDRLHLSKIGDVRYRNSHRPKGAEARTCTVKRDARGHWHAVIVFRVPDIKRNEEDLEHPRTPAAYDLGLRDLITDTDGNKVAVPDFYGSEKENIAKLQRRMGSSEKGSPMYERARRRLAILHGDIHRRRRGFLHRTAAGMVDGHTVVVMEDLEVRKMKERPDRGPATRDKYTEASWRSLIDMVGSKAEEAGIPLVLVDPGYTSRTCCRCGAVKDPLPLSERTFRCGCCGSSMDRDRNAAINILNRGLVMQTFRESENGQPC